MAIGKREKLVALGITGIVIIGAAHFLVFSKKTQQFVDAKKVYDDAIANVKQLRRPQGLQQLEKYETETNEQYRDPFLKVVDTFNIERDEIFNTWNDNQGDLTLLDQCYALIGQEFDSLLERRAKGDRGEGPRLSFLESGQYSWNIPRNLPSTVQSGQSNLFDLLEEVEGQFSTLQAVRPDDPFRQRAQLDYERALSLLEINFKWSIAQGTPIASYFDLYQVCGPAAMFLKMFEHARLYFARQPETNPDFANVHEIIKILGYNDVASVQEVPRIKDILFDDPSAPLSPGPMELDITKAGYIHSFAGASMNSFDLRWFFYYYLPQLRALVEMIDMADRAGVREFQFVRMREARMIEPVVDMSEATPTPEPTPFMDEMMMMGMGMGMGMEQGAGGYYDFGMSGMGGYGGFGMVSTPKPPDIGAAVAIPIDMIILGDNASTSEFLYELTHAHRAYELDSLRIEGRPDQQTQTVLLQTTLSVNVIGQILNMDISAIKPAE